MRPPDDDFSSSVHGCLGQLVSYLVMAAVLFFVVLFVGSYFFRTTLTALLIIWLGLMFFVSLLFLVRMSEERD